MKLTKLTLSTLILIASTTTNAGINANKGFYVGADAVTAYYTRPPGSAINWQIVLFSSRDGNSGFISPYIGYRFNDYLAVESSFNNIEDENNNATEYMGPDHYRLYSFDLTGKAIYPFESGLSIFIKAGGAVTHQNVYNQTFNNGLVTINSNVNQPQFVAGAGVSYNFTKNIASDLVYTHYFPSGVVKAIDMLGLGLSYTFGGNQDNQDSY